MRAVIFANGKLNQSFTPQEDDIIIAADGGAKHCLSLGISPSYVIGDMDSLTDQDLEQLSDQGAEIISYPTRKDYTDLELALQHTSQLKVDKILVLAALGDRWDQTIANLLLPLAFESLQISLMDDQQEIHFLRSGERLEILGNAGETVSLVPIAGDAFGVSTEGLEYPLEAENLILGKTRGISNVMLNSKAIVTITEGSLLCIQTHNPEEPSQE